MAQFRSQDPLETPGMPSAMQRESKQKNKKKNGREKTHWMKSCKAACCGYSHQIVGLFCGVSRRRRGAEKRKLKGILRFPPSLRVFSHFFSLFFCPRQKFHVSQRQPQKSDKKNDKVSERTPRHLRESGCFPLAGRVSRWEVPHDQGHHKAGKEKDW